MQVFNTMTMKKEKFKPLKEGAVSIYCCGVTPYSTPHIGNARPFVVWDVIRRFFAKRGYKVKYIQNFTDVDDKIIAAANAEGVTWKEISERNIDIYFETMDALNIRRADVYPKVSETMSDIIAMIDKLLLKGYAYELSNGDVFYSVDKDAEYGKLSGRTRDDMLAGARVEVDKRKHNPMDFALWKAAKPGEPFWHSPWGDGRPGWHIECSAMSLKYLGEKFDFHGGGSDLIFPHHENEIAQSQSVIGDNHSFAQYWLHNGFITKGNKKVSKSDMEEMTKDDDKPFFNLDDILKEYPGEIIRFLLLQTHYRSPLEFNEDRVKEVIAPYNRLKNSFENLNDLAERIENGEFVSAQKNKSALITMSPAGGLVELAERLLASFDDAMNDDFNTALAISHMIELSHDVNSFYSDYISGRITTRGADAFIIMRVREIFMEMAEILGIMENIDDVDDSADAELVNDLIEIILSIRKDARSAKNWAVADKIRDELKAAGIILEDTPQGVKWKKI